MPPALTNVRLEGQALLHFDQLRQQAPAPVVAATEAVLNDFNRGQLPRHQRRVLEPWWVELVRGVCAVSKSASGNAVAKSIDAARHCQSDVIEVRACVRLFPPWYLCWIPSFILRRVILSISLLFYEHRSGGQSTARIFVLRVQEGK